MGTHKTVALARFVHFCVMRIDTRVSTCENLRVVDEDGEQPRRLKGHVNPDPDPDPEGPALNKTIRKWILRWEKI